MTKPNFIVIPLLAQKTAQGKGNREGCPYDDVQKTAPFFVPKKPRP